MSKEDEKTKQVKKATTGAQIKALIALSEHSGSVPFRQSHFTGEKTIKVFRPHDKEFWETRYYVLGVEIPKTWFVRLQALYRNDCFPGETFGEYIERNETAIFGMMK